MEFSTPDGQPFKKGQYLKAKRNPFRDGHVGLSISGHGRGCYEVDGSFEVLEIEYDDLGRVRVLAMDFKQVCDYRGLLSGSIRYNSSIPISGQEQEGQLLEIRMKGNEGYLTGDKLYTRVNGDVRPLLPIRDFGQHHVLHLDVEGYSLTFVPPQDQPYFKVGRYSNANRFPFQEAGNPGMNISGHGCGCNHVEGDFEIKEIEYNEDNVIKVLALDFEHYCEGKGDLP